MYAITTAVLSHLGGDAALAALAPGGVYDRVPKRTQPGATPAAFLPLPGKEVPRLRETITLFGPNEVLPGDGPVQTGVVVLRLGFLRLYYYVPATASGKVAIDAIDTRVRQLLHDWQLDLAYGATATFAELDSSDLAESDHFPGSKQMIRRYSVEYLRPSV